MKPAKRSTSKTEFKVLPLTIENSKVLHTNSDNSDPPTPNSDSEFRSPRRRTKTFNLPTKNTIKPTPNRFEILAGNTVINDQEMTTCNNNNASTSQIENLNNHNIQPQTNDSTPKIPQLLITNISKFSKF